jgi:hypothetical protein
MKNQTPFSSEQLNKLANAWSSLDKIDPCSDSYKKLIKTLDAMPQCLLSQLADANVKFISMLAKRRVVKLAAVLALVLTSGCSGIGFKTEVYRIDERQESSRTHRKPMGLKCLFLDCDTRTVDESAGS